MLKLEDLKPGLPLVGLEPSVVATVAAVVPIGEGAVQVFYRTPDGTTKERLLGHADEESLSIATVEAVRQLAYRLYTFCEHLSQAEDARAYNELITSWTGIESAAAKEPAATQRRLFE